MPPPEPFNQNTRQRRLFFLSLFFLCVVTFLSFSSVLNNGFTNWDDQMHIEDNYEIRKLDFKHISTIFTSTSTNGYIPLTILSFAVEYHFFKLNPFVYHLNNLLLHLGVVILIFLFARRIGLSLTAAFWGSLLFGIHPLHAESVTWITERKDVLYAVFYMLALYRYWLYLEQKKKFDYILTIVFGFLSMLAKPMALSLPLVLWVCDRLYGRKWDHTVWIDKIPHFLYVVPLAWITYSLQEHFSANSLFEGIMIWVWTLTFYLKKFVFPIHLGPFYQLPQPISLLNFSYGGSFLILFLLVWSLIRFRKNALFVFSILFYIFSIFFLLRQVDISYIGIVEDRYMYLPSLGFCLLFGKGIETFFLRTKKGSISKRIFCVLLAVLFLGLSVRTFIHCDVWKDSITLWTHIIERRPPFEKAYSGRGAAYLAEGEYDLALVDIEEAIRLEKNSFRAYNKRSLILLHQGQYDLAIADNNRALEVNPQSKEAYNNRGVARVHKGQYDLAIADFSRALEIDPQSPNAYLNRAIVYYKLKQYDKSWRDVREMERIGWTVDQNFYDLLRKTH